MDKNIIETFLDKRLVTNYNSRKSYRINLNKYFSVIKKDMNTYFNETKPLEEYEDDLNKVYMQQEENNKPFLSRKNYFSIIKLFMKHYDKRTADMEFWGILRGKTKGAEPESDEDILNKETIKKIISHGNTCSRALFLMLASSGRRIGEILALYPEDIDTSTTPATLNVKKTYDISKPDKVHLTTKTKQKTLCFISEEAKEAYLTWMKERDTYLKNAVYRTRKHTNKNPDDKRVFPMGYDNALVMWTNLLVKAEYAERKEVTIKGKKKKKIVTGKDENTRRLLKHPHALRKYFISYLGDYPLADYLAGHYTTMTKAYNKMTIEDRGAAYTKLMMNVTFFSNAPDLSGMHDEIKELKDENQKLRNYLQDMDQDLKKLLRQDDKKNKK